MHEYEVQITIRLRFAAAGHAEAVAKRQRIMAVLAEGARVIQARTGMLIRFSQNGSQPRADATPLSRAVRVEIGKGPRRRRRKVVA